MTHTIEAGKDAAALDRAIESVPNLPAVFVLWPREGEPYLGRTALLRRRLKRLLRERDRPSRMLNLRGTAARIEYQLTGSALESSVVMYRQARRLFPSRYLDLLKLRMPPYIRIVRQSAFPRSMVTTHLARAADVYFGPFGSRASAEKFESQLLDLFQMRRCQEDLEPAADHPGCIYGEMSMCLRPCQLVVGRAEYAHEVERVVEFLRTGGASLADAIARSRERLSEELRFEEAARQHKRFEKVREVARLAGELARDLERLDGVAVTPSADPMTVELWFVRAGCCHEAVRFGFEVKEGKAVSLDQRLRELAAALTFGKPGVRERQEHLALLARWYYSSWRDGEWIAFPDYGAIPYRKLVNAISRLLRPDTAARE